MNANYQAWLSCPGMNDELLEQLHSMNEEEISDSFYRELAFGTGGLRGVLGAGTNRMNVYTVSKATRGLGKYLLETFEQPSCAVSYDSRIHSKDFAELTAATLADMGVKVHLYPALMPTPMLSFAVRHLKCSAGVMVTASHNPAKFNGYKVYGSDGCQITIEAADRIYGYICAEETLVPELPDFAALLAAGKISYIGEDTIETYYQAIDKLRVSPATQRLQVVYSPLNGTGNVPVREMLKRLGNIDVEVVREQELPDGHFPTCPYPNPEIREAMKLAIAQTIASKADLCIATDPDCDRIGAGVRQGDEVTLISGNDMGVLLLDYICSHRQHSELPPVAVKTIVTTEMAVSICKKYGVELRNVLTGFKFIGEQIGLLEKEGHAERYLFGFEESYGYLSGTDVRDKDAVNAAVLVCEMAANYKAQGLTLLDKLAELRAEHGFFAQRLLTFEYEGESGQEKMNGIMASLRAPAETFAESALRTASRIDYLNDDTGLPASDVLSFAIADASIGGGAPVKVIVRPSGTEPKLKAYLFAQGKDQAAAEKVLDQLEALVNAHCKA
ncbi:MAG: phospho-sugar mutase [Christensenellaceae bacterium]|nr:phospho-sugar mutase [Christensenellaceae bacterium]